jgi:putative serine protease PepD
VPFDDDAEADSQGFRPPPHPDDRLWRHPSEMSDHPIIPIGAPLPPALIATPSATQRADGGPRRSWGAFAVAAATGALLAGGGVVALGLDERVVERSVTERVALGPTTSAGDAAGADPLAGVRQRVEPAVVGIEAPGLAPGSGVVVRDDGIVVTSAAFVAGGTLPQVHLADGTDAVAALVGTDPVTGLAVLDLPGEGHTPSVLAVSAELASGATTFVLHARESGGTVTGSGVVGATHRYVGPTGTPLDGIAVEGVEGAGEAAALGGPAVDERGAVVGIVTAVEDGGEWYVTPVDVAHRVADDLLATGEVRHCWLGIEGTDVAGDGSTGSPDTTLPTEGGGTLVASIVPGSPAEEGGLRVGDVIVALDDRRIARMPDLTVALRSHAPGDRVDVTVRREDDTRVTLVLTLAETPSPSPSA